MTVSAIDPSNLAQFGFAALMAGVIWRAFEQLSLRVLQVVENNTRAYEQLSSAVQSNTTTVSQLETTVRRLQESVQEIEAVIGMHDQAARGHA